MLNRYVILANPGSKRWELYSQELHHFWEEQQDAAEIHLLPWIEVLNQKGDLSGFPQFEKSALVRLESPGRNFEVTKALLQLGDPAQSWDELPYRKGHLLQPGALYRGFCNALQRIDETLKKPHLLSLCDAGEVMEVFDKNATLSRFRTRDLPCPESLTPPEKAEERFTLYTTNKLTEGQRGEDGW